MLACRAVRANYARSYSAVAEMHGWSSHAKIQSDNSAFVIGDGNFDSLSSLHQKWLLGLVSRGFALG